MITPYDAYKKIVSDNPDKYVHVMNEYDDRYTFVLINKDEEVCDTTFVFWISVMDKHTGRIEEIPFYEAFANDDYTRIDISKFEKEA